MSELEISLRGRKALCVQLGELAGSEIADLLQRLAERVEELERGKVDVTPIIPLQSPDTRSRRRLSA